MPYNDYCTDQGRLVPSLSKTFRPGTYQPPSE